jgi:hypothetical protein
MTNDQKNKFEKYGVEVSNHLVLVIVISNFGFVWDLVLVVCNLNITP